MALIKCKECGKEISDQAKICPNCGAKTENAKHKKNTILIIIIIVGLIVFSKFFNMYSTYTNSPVHQYSQEAITILKEYKEDKNSISISQLHAQIENLNNNFEEKYKNILEDKNHKNYNHYSAFIHQLSSITLNISLDASNTSTIDNNKIDEYINRLQGY